MEYLEGSKVVVLDYEDLARGKDLSSSIEVAYNYEGLGLLAVKNVPNVQRYRAELLPYASRLGMLSPEEKRSLEDARSVYNVGWSEGKEKFEGEFDTLKGSFYFNPLYDHPSDDEQLVHTFPETFVPNIWPSKLLPEFEGAAKQLSRLMVGVGVLVAEQCDKYTRSRIPRFPRYSLRQSITHSATIKARLLHYFPLKDPSKLKEGGWCGWHNDHGSLTALCPAMFLREGDWRQEVPNTDDKSGLWIKTRRGEEVRVSIPKDHLAFQIGETAQIQSGGFLRATPHSVMPSRFPDVVRNTLAVFMQPNFDVLIDPPPGVPVEQVYCERYRPGMTFGEFHKVTIDSFY